MENQKQYPMTSEGFEKLERELEESQKQLSVLKL